MHSHKVMDGTIPVAHTMLLYNILSSLHLFHNFCVSATILYEIFYIAVHLWVKFNLFVCVWVLSYQPETLVTMAFSVLPNLLSMLVDVAVKVGVGSFLIF
jgi:hypothetical protein